MSLTIYQLAYSPFCIPITAANAPFRAITNS